jgi:hypothetical protein
MTMKRTSTYPLLLAALFITLTPVLAATTEQKPAATPAAPAAKTVKQPHMEAALAQLTKAKDQLAAAHPAAPPDKGVKELLRKAKAQLDQAADNKGGHKAKAMAQLKQAAKAGTNADALKAVDTALTEVQLGMDFAAGKAKK